MPDISINCTTEEGKNARMKAKILGKGACAVISAKTGLTNWKPKQKD